MGMHTPGPWTINGSAIETDNTIIAHIYDPDENGPDEFAANAHLIAAAPDLLAACEWLLDAIGDKSRDEHTIYAKEQARAAIRTARGE